MSTDYLLTARVLTPLHIGAGQGAGFIDLPVLREAVTGWPVIPGSAVKGSLAEALNVPEDSARTVVSGEINGNHINGNQKLTLAFGRADTAGDEKALGGALIFTDLHLIFLPVRSLFGSFAYVSCNMALQRFKHYLDLFAPDAVAFNVPDPPGDEGKVAVSAGSALTQDDKVWLHDLELNKSADAPDLSGLLKLFGALLSPEQAKARIAIVHDDVFRYLCDYALEVRARNKLDKDTKTTVRGALWYEEFLPEEALFAGFLSNQDNRIEATGYISTDGTNLQMGGKESVGKGMVQLRLHASPPVANPGAGA